MGHILHIGTIPGSKFFRVTRIGQSWGLRGKNHENGQKSIFSVFAYFFDPICVNLARGWSNSVGELRKWIKNNRPTPELVDLAIFGAFWTILTKIL